MNDFADPGRMTAGGSALPGFTSPCVEVPLSQRLAEIAVSSVNSLYQLDQQCEKCKSRKAFLTEQIHAFQLELAAILVEANSLSEQKEAAELASVEELCSACVLNLGSQSDFIELRVQNELRYLTLQSRHAALLESNPELESQLEEYRKTESVWHEFESVLLGDYLQALQDVRERYRERLAPILLIEDEIVYFQTGENQLKLDVLLCVLDAIQQVVVVLPIHSEVRDLDGDASKMLAGLADVLEEACLELAYLPNIYITEIDWITWHGFATVQMMVQGCEETIVIVEALRHALHDHLKGTGIFRDNPAIDVIQVDAKVWMNGLRIPVLEIPDKESHVLDALATSSEQSALANSSGLVSESDIEGDNVSAEVPIVDDPNAPVSAWDGKSSQWFTSDDLRSWSRPLRIAQGSTWSVAARRARTLLVRLIARGHVGIGGVSREDLLEGLPPVHLKGLAGAIDNMVSQSVLSKSSIEAGARLFLNPDYLSEAENLINREVSEKWDLILRAV